MKKTLSKISLLTLLLPFFVFAQDTPGIDNPLKPQFDSLPNLIFALVDIVSTIGFYIAVFFIIYSGFLFVKARGNEKDIGTAKEALKWTLIGTAVLLGARVIADVIQGTLDQVEAREIPAEVIKHV